MSKTGHSAARPKTLSQQAQDAQQQAQDVQRRVDELQPRAPDATAADYSQLQRETRRARRDAGIASSLCLRPPSRTPPRRSGSGSSLRSPRHGAPRSKRPHPSQSPTPRRPGERPKTARPPSDERLASTISPHNRIEHDLPESEKTCSGCGGMEQRIGEDLSRELRVHPGQTRSERPRPCPSTFARSAATAWPSPPVPSKLVKGGIAGPEGWSPSCWSASSPRPPHALQARRYLDPARRASVAEQPCATRWVRNAADLLEPLAAAATEDAGFAVPGVVDRRLAHVLVLGERSPAVPRVDSGPTSAIPSTHIASTTSR